MNVTIEEVEAFLKTIQGTPAYALLMRKLLLPYEASIEAKISNPMLRDMVTKAFGVVNGIIGAPAS